jgi:hypothetical protein
VRIDQMRQSQRQELHSLRDFHRQQQLALSVPQC